MIRIAPSILSADFVRLGEQIRAVEGAGADWIHLDVMDGHFVPNITFGPLLVEAVGRMTDLPLDVHLMIEEPDRYVAAFCEAGADSVSVHAEASGHLHRTLQLIRDHEVRAGVAINPATPIQAIDHILDMVDIVLVMTVNPGFGGQHFIEATIPKIRAVAERILGSGRSIEVEVDGGIGPQTAPGVVKAGATVLVAGSAIFGAEDAGEAVVALRRSVES